jgi:hypothetical protein
MFVMRLDWFSSRNLAVAACATLCCLFGWTLTAQAAAPPVIESESAYEVTLDGATLQVQLNPEGSETTYSFEYGTSTSYGSTAPTPVGPAGSGTTPETVEARLKGLTAGTVYHYRALATNGGVTVYGEDKTFITFAVEPSNLPDERAYELVSPVDKNGGEIDGGIFEGNADVPLQASEDGNAVTYVSSTSFGASPLEEKGAPGSSSYISRRGPNGWSTQNVTGPDGQKTEPAPLTAEASTVEAMTPDLSTAFFVSSSPLLQGSFAGLITPYLQDAATGQVQALLLAAPPHREPYVGYGEFDPIFAGATSDFSHVLFTANDTLTPEAVGSSAESRNLYEWADGRIRLVNVLPNGEVLSGEQASGQNPTFGSIQFKERSNLSNVISADGSRVFWSDEADRELFARVDGTHTILLSQSQKTNGTGPGGKDPMGTQMPIYQGASANGADVFFTSAEELTNNANTGNEASCAPLPGDCAADLYRYSMETGQLTDLTADSVDATGADVWGVVGSSEDGSYVYFVANGALASGATPGSCDEFSSGVCNLYVWHEGAGTRFIGKVSKRDLGSGPTIDGEAPQAVEGISSEDLEAKRSRVSPNGKFVAFQSTSQLTGYNNTPVAGPYCEGPEDFAKETAAQCAEVFRYDAESGQLVCVSCNPTGARPIGPSAVPFRVGEDLGRSLHHAPKELGWETRVYQQRYLSDSGRLFFDTVDTLSPHDTNGQADVYEYENGEAHLISGGFGGEASMFMDASASGDDVFFLTRDQLTLQDRDEAVDLYDARVGAPQNLASPPPCASSDACKPGPTPQPSAFGAPASATFSGAGNIAQPTPTKSVKRKGAAKSRKRKAKPKKKKARKSKKKAKKSQKSNGQASNRRKR